MKPLTILKIATGKIEAYQTRNGRITREFAVNEPNLISDIENHIIELRTIICRNTEKLRGMYIDPSCRIPMRVLIRDAIKDLESLKPRFESPSAALSLAKTDDTEG